MILALGLMVAHGFPVPDAFFNAYELLMDELRTGRANRDLPEPLHVTAIRRIKATSFPVDYARNEIVRGFLESDADSLFFLDCDHTFSPDVVTRLLRHEVDVVTARYHMRREPFHACAFVKDHRSTNGKPHMYRPVHLARGLIEIERGGAGALLVRREVFEAIRDRVGENWFRYQRGPDPPHDFSVSEDFWFYRQVREAGYRCYCDWDTECQHLQMFAIGHEWNEAFLQRQFAALSTRPPDERRETLASLVVRGYPDGYQLPTGEVIPEYVITPGER